MFTSGTSNYVDLILFPAPDWSNTFHIRSSILLHRTPSFILSIWSNHCITSCSARSNPSSPSYLLIPHLMIHSSDSTQIFQIPHLHCIKFSSFCCSHISSFSSVQLYWYWYFLIYHSLDFCSKRSRLKHSFHSSIHLTCPTLLILSFISPYIPPSATTCDSKYFKHDISSSSFPLKLHSLSHLPSSYTSLVHPFSQLLSASFF